ncbi:MAG: hypothetical protein K6G64_09660 [Eubacterium sp.]|nr:hypothetical protein [Eubacterium sp.]
MLQNQKVKKIKHISVAVFAFMTLSVAVGVGAAFLNTNRDTRPVPERVESAMEYTDAYTELCTVGDYKYLFFEEKDIIAVENVKTGWVWKTGLDVPSIDTIKDGRKKLKRCQEDILALKGKAKVSDKGKTEDEVIKAIIEKIEKGDVKIESDTYTGFTGFANKNNMSPVELMDFIESTDSSFQSDQFVDFANSLITVEYYEGSGDNTMVQKASSAPCDDDTASSLTVVDESTHKYKLQCEFKLGAKAEKLGVNVYLTFNEDGTINFQIPNKEISGENARKKLKDIIVAPFLGASGGILNYFDGKGYNKAEIQDVTPGYVFVPDGSGALIRFAANSATFNEYSGDVYGTDPATALHHYAPNQDEGVSQNVVPLKNPTMPVYGISQGDGTQAAFLAYADSGDEYMSIHVLPESTQPKQNAYTYAYASFLYNSEYYQVTNQQGDAYRKIQDNMNDFDVDFTIHFLSGDGSDGTQSADYAGMAKAYREHLIEKGVLTEVQQGYDSIPLRIDFLMSDSKNGVFSTKEVAVTTADDVKSILEQVSDNGISNINSGLIGWQSGGETLSKPNSTSFSSTIGSEGNFSDVMGALKDKGIDVSFSREFVTINEDMISYYNNAAKHLSTQYMELDRSEVLPSNCPVTEYGYALPEKSAEWLKDLYGDLGDLSNSITIDGISNKLISSYTSNKTKRTTAVDTIKLYQDAVKGIKDNGTKINMVNPNKYMWQYTDRYLQSPIGTSQYVYETDTVPFLQMVLHGTMEVYAPYANFSFYSNNDMLRMIDYNASPSFVLTKQPSYLLSATASADYYSTEYEQYKELINTIYTTVNKPLSEVVDYSWDSRTVFTWDGSKLVQKPDNGDEATGGVIANQYSKDGTIKTIIINYTDEDIVVNGVTIAATSAGVVEGGVE